MSGCVYGLWLTTFMLKLLSQLESPEELRKRFVANPTSFYDSDYIVLQEELLHMDEKLFLQNLDQYENAAVPGQKKIKRILVLHCKGDYYATKAQWPEAMVCYESAASLAKEEGLQLAEATVNHALIGVYLKRQQWMRLYEVFQSNDAIYESLDLIPEKINTLLQFSLYYQFCGCLEDSAKIIKSIFHLNEMISKTPVRHNYTHNRVLIYLAKANLEKKSRHFHKALEYCLQVEVILKEFVFGNQDSQFLSRYQALVLALKTECYLDLGYEEKSKKMIERLEALSEKMPDVVNPFKVNVLRAEYEFQFNNFPLPISEWLVQLKDLILMGETEFALEQFTRILKHFHKNFPLTHYEKIMIYYESFLRLCDRKLPIKVRKDFHSYYNFNPHQRVMISPHHMMIKFVEVSRELMSEYDVKRLAKKVLLMMVDFTQMERGLFVIGGRQPEMAAFHELNSKNINDESTEEALCRRLATFSAKTGRTLNISDLTTVNLNEQFLPEEYQTERWHLLQSKSVIVVPFMLDEHVLGAVYLDSKVRRPQHNDEEITFLENFAMNVAMALKNADSFSRKDQALMTVQRELTDQRQQLIHQFSISSFIGASEKTHALLHVVEKIAESSASVLLLGESGVGKEVVAKTIHYNSHRKQKPFVAINCGAIPENLLESELFGYERGSFTGAAEAKKGLFEQAGEGTIFLDEIGELPMSMQVKILRVLEENEVMPIGANQPRPVHVRVVCATNRNLEEMIQQGTFRSDLYFRINVITIKVPSLRDRKSDVPLLIRHALKLYADENKVPVKTMSADALNFLMNYPWPGNVRELINVVYNLSIFVETPTIGLNDIKARPELFQIHQHSHSSQAILSQDPMVELSHKIDEGELTLSDAKQEFEKLQIARALKLCSGKITSASTLLQMPRPQVSRLIKKYGLKEEDERMH